MYKWLFLLLFLPFSSYAQDMELQQRINTLNAVLEDLKEQLEDLQPVKKVVPKTSDERFVSFLGACESGNRADIIHWADKKITGYPSYGKYGYQPHTFLKFGKEYGLFPNDLTMKDAMKLIFNEGLQDEMTRLAIADNQHKHWLNCWKKYQRV